MTFYADGDSRKSVRYGGAEQAEAPRRCLKHVVGDCLEMEELCLAASCRAVSAATDRYLCSSQVA